MIKEIELLRKCFPNSTWTADGIADGKINTLLVERVQTSNTADPEAPAEFSVHFSPFGLLKEWFKIYKVSKAESNS